MKAWWSESYIYNRRIAQEQALIRQLKRKLANATAPLKRARYCKRIRAAEVRIVAMTLEKP